MKILYILYMFGLYVPSTIAALDYTDKKQSSTPQLISFYRSFSSIYFPRPLGFIHDHAIDSLPPSFLGYRTGTRLHHGTKLIEADLSIAIQVDIRHHLLDDGHIVLFLDQYRKG